MTTSPSPHHDPSPRRLSRRSLLTGLGVGALSATPVGAFGTRAALAEDSSAQALDGTYDVIIVGAGYAGVTAARELTGKGLRTLVLEARDRVGGRILSTTWAGQPIELGGQWVSEQQPHATRELRRYGITTAPGGVPIDRAFYPTPQGPRQFAFEEANARMGTLMAQLFDGSQQYFERPYEPLHRSDLLAAVDPLSLRDRINQLGLAQQDELWLAGLTAGYAGGSNTWAGLTGMAQWWALAGWTPQGWDGQTVYRPDGGMIRLLRAMLDESRARVALRTPVTAITDDRRGVAVTTRAGRVLRARAAVVAVPVNVWRTIRFTPGLPAAHAAAATQGMGVPNVTKLWARLSAASGRTFAQGAEGDPVSLLFPQATLPNGEQLVLAFSEDPALNVTDPARVQEAMRRIAPEVTVLDVTAQSWGKDPYSLGGWGMRRPNQLLTLLPGVQQPYGRIAFSTADIASGWYGAFIDGAIESGTQAARQVIDLLA